VPQRCRSQVMQVLDEPLPPQAKQVAFARHGELGAWEIFRCLPTSDG
jgi:hypothetical protein